MTLFDAKAADAVEYDRVKPEAAILNANTGTETAFYESLKTEAHNKLQRSRAVFGRKVHAAVL